MRKNDGANFAKPWLNNSIKDAKILFLQIYSIKTFKKFDSEHKHFAKWLQTQQTGAQYIWYSKLSWKFWELYPRKIKIVGQVKKRSNFAEIHLSNCILLQITLFLPRVTFLYSLKTSEHRIRHTQFSHISRGYRNVTVGTNGITCAGLGLTLRHQEVAYNILQVIFAFILKSKVHGFKYTFLKKNWIIRN